MERVNTLINKLQEQANNGSNAAQILSTAQLLVAELSGIELPEQIGKVSVWMPSVYFSNTTSEATIKQPVVAIAEPIMAMITDELISDFSVVAEEETMPTIEPITSVVIEELIVSEEMMLLDEPFIEDANTALVVEEDVMATVAVEPTQIVAEDTIVTAQQPVEVAARRAAMVAVKPKEIYNIEVLDEEEIQEDVAPVLVMQTKTTNREMFELNDVMHNDVQSFNDVLRENKKEVATNLVDTPVKDLRKAIGINEKYLYINELFQGDENMYERSIKTINGFSVFPEAEHWIRRELHTKLCWINDNETVKQFDQLVRRRFA